MKNVHSFKAGERGKNLRDLRNDVEKRKRKREKNR